MEDPYNTGPPRKSQTLGTVSSTVFLSYDLRTAAPQSGQLLSQTVASEMLCCSLPCYFVQMSHLMWNPLRQYAAAAGELPGNELLTAGFRVTWDTQYLRLYGVRM
jgi:hypothetical protein